MALNVLSLWTMSLFNLNTQPSDVIVSGVINGLGLGFIVTPLSTIAYSTLSPKLRNEGTSMYSLTRNLGSSIGISVVITQLSQGTQMHRASLVERISEFDVQSWSDGARSFLTPDNPVNLTILDYTVNTQAAVMSYIDDFRLIMIAAALSIPSLLLMKRPDYSVAIAQQVAPDHG